MLVCNVSLRPPRSAIAATVTEISIAVDATATGNVIFAALVDDPASVGDIVDAYLGAILLETASASDTVDLELAYSAAVDEAATAVDTHDAVVTGAATARQAMIAGAFVNSGSVSRDANVNGVMVNL